MAIVLNPSDGLRNVATYPTNPTTEAAAREQMQSVVDQVVTQANAELADKAKKRTSLNAINGWERDFDTGIIEQWGYGYVAGAGGNVITLPISESDTDYNLILTPYYAGSGVPKIKISNVTKYNFTVSAESESYFYWRIQGW